MYNGVLYNEYHKAKKVKREPDDEVMSDVGASEGELENDFGETDYANFRSDDCMSDASLAELDELAAE